MIKFFRNIRKNMLSEGQTLKYLKYAIGEVFLVVIGILIALQLNNLNDIRKIKKFENEILLQIQENLINDRIALKQIESNFEEAISSSNKILQSNISPETGGNISNWLGTIIQFDRFQPLTNAYEVLKSDGLDKISNKKLRFMLGKYYDNEALGIIKATSDIEMAFNDHWIPILFEETVSFEFKRSVELNDYTILLKPSKERNILKLSRDNYSSGIKKITSGLKTIDEIQDLISSEIK